MGPIFDWPTGRTRPAGVHHALIDGDAACGHAVVNRSKAGTYPVTCKHCIRVLPIPTGTVVRVSPNPKRTLPEEDATLIRDAMTNHEKSYAALREAVVTAHRKGAGVRALAEYTGMSTKTIVRWNAEVE